MRSARSASWVVIAALAAAPFALGTFAGPGHAQSAPSKVAAGTKVGVHFRTSVTTPKPGDSVIQIAGVVGSVDATGFMLSTTYWHYGDGSSENGNDAKCTVYVPWTSVNYVEIDPLDLLED